MREREIEGERGEREARYSNLFLMSMPELPMKSWHFVVLILSWSLVGSPAHTLSSSAISITCVHIPYIGPHKIYSLFIILERQKIGGGGWMLFVLFFGHCLMNVGSQKLSCSSRQPHNGFCNPTVGRSIPHDGF